MPEKIMEFRVHFVYITHIIEYLACTRSWEYDYGEDPHPKKVLLEK